MRAAQIVAPQTLRIVSLPDPRPQDLPSGWVLVQVERGCICGSDSPYFLGVHGTPLDPGLSLHECLGTVLASRSPLRSPGDRVLAVPLEQRGFAELFATPRRTDRPPSRGPILQRAADGPAPRHRSLRPPKAPQSP
ncbi:MAG: hypothetical protein KatS3mg115_1659 [Candidatus Poribacteria bacterium]|nr:MAG: hypothetical protein KatS3mg115_1659 [Candidatus Poribacteria bacterium]